MTQSGPQTAIIYAFSVPTMVCQQGCADPIRNALVQIAGVQGADVQFVGLYARVLVDPAQVTAQRLIQTINEAGHTATYLGTISLEDAQQNRTRPGY